MSIRDQIRIAQDSLKAKKNMHIMKKVFKEHIEDQKLREKHPSLQKAWEEYQLVKELCK